MSSLVSVKSSMRRGLHAFSKDELQKELSLLQAAVMNLDQQELASPILTEQDFLRKLLQMKRAYKQSRFDSNLKSATKHLYEYLKKAKKKETHEYWKARTLLYELNDVFGISQEINETTSNDGQKVLDELRFQSVRWNKGGLMLLDRKLVRERVLFCSCRGNELRRRGELSVALNLFEWLLDFTTHKLKGDAFPCYGTRAALCYHIGSTLRALEQHRLAESMYSQALDLLYARGIRREEADSNEHIYLIRKQAMVVGLGFGWINLTRGFLARAENALSTARSMLVSVNDPLVSAYVGLLYGTIRRCRAGTDKDKLAEAIGELQRIRRSFMNHPRYQARTCWELALAKMLAGDINGAQNDLRLVATYADQTLNRKWQVNVQILESRIHRKRGEFEDARARADAAVEMAKSPDCKTILPLVDALITRGEAHLFLADKSGLPESNFSAALADFNGALQTMSARRENSGKIDYLSNPKIASVCVLRLAQCYARMGHQTDAKKHFAMWLRLEPHVEHEWIRELAARTKTEIDRLSMDFTVSAQESKDWSYATNVVKLRRWLLTQALRQTKWNYSEAAKLIGVQRATLYQWQNQPEREGSRTRKSKGRRA